MTWYYKVRGALAIEVVGEELDFGALRELAVKVDAVHSLSLLVARLQGGGQIDMVGVVRAREHECTDLSGRRRPASASRKVTVTRPVS